jgi:orotidine-5'-phosphate decarboxylase
MIAALSYSDKLRAAWAAQDSMLCVGLDPDSKRYPAHLSNDPDRAYLFCKAIVDATAPYACAFKPQIAYFAAQSAEAQLERLCTYIRSAYPAHVLVLDSKRGDIGDTAKQYALEAFERYHADAVTVNPYMGFDTITPYLAHAGKGVIVLCRTSNAGGSDFQSLHIGNDETLYERIARLAATRWNTDGQLSLVVGATFPAELAKVRALVGDMPLLVPGVGAQGGDVLATVAAGSDLSGYGMMINSSRAILYASSGADFASAAALVARQTRDAIRLARQPP